MSSLTLYLAIFLAVGAAQGFPLHGSDGTVNCTVFDAFRNPISGNDTGNVSITLDIAVSGTSEVNLSLVDEANASYQLDPNLSMTLQPGRAMVAFVIPKSAGIKGLKVSPSGGLPFLVAWPNVTKYTNGVANLRYFGIAAMSVEASQKTLTLDLRLSNNGTDESMIMAPANFTIVDQWGWRYYAEETFDPISIPPRNYSRKGITFSGLSPLSRPVRIEYDFWSPRRISIDLEEAPPALSAAAPAATTDHAKTAPSERATDTQDRVAEAKDRLAQMQKKFHLD